MTSNTVFLRSLAKDLGRGQIAVKHLTPIERAIFLRYKELGVLTLNEHSEVCFVEPRAAWLIKGDIT
jgi:hypothetical protein